MKTLRERVEQRVRDTVCRACIYEKADGGCNLDPGRDCPILGRVDKLIEVVRTTHSDDIDPYVARLREAVCAECEMQDGDGQCPLRRHADCALDDYFVLIVDLIEQELAVEPRP
ncbi:MAG: hypothetical protein U1A27_12400 [Phycisphaerae bacterium]